MHLEKEIIWARVGEPAVVEVKARARVRAKAKAVVVVEIKVVLSAPADFVFVQNVAKKCPISEE
jgi:predicted nucleotidyltransferase